MAETIEAEERRARLTGLFAKRSGFYDRLAIIIETLGTVTGAALFALAGLPSGFDQSTVYTFFWCGVVITLISFAFFSWNRLGLFNTISDAVTASHEGARLRLEGRALKAEAELDLRRKDDVLAAERMSYEERIAHMESDLGRKLRAAGEQARSFQSLGEMRSRCLILTRTLLDMAQHYLQHPEKERNLNYALRTLLNTVGSGPGRAAFAFDADVRWTVSIFRRIKESDETEVIVREQVLRWDGDTNPSGRRWHRGESYSGHAWLTGDPVIIPDTANAPLIHRPEENARTTDSDKYKSVAAIPVRTGASEHVWGVVTATSDRLGHFGNEGDGVAAQLHADSMRSLAAFVSLLVAGSAE
ncbi:MAG: GAF domain-containing protein [Sphingomonas sp.]